MGNRVLIQFVGNDGDFSPVIYGHWHGSNAAQTLIDLQKQMESRGGDVSYIAARCVERMCLSDPGGDTGFGIWNTDKPLTEDESHGDAGVWLVDVSVVHWYVTILGGAFCEYGPLPKAKSVSFKAGAA
jgi:hypothetical protein